MFFQFVDSLIQAKSQTTTKNSQEFSFIHSKSKEKGGRDEKNPLKIFAIVNKKKKCKKNISVNGRIIPVLRFFQYRNNKAKEKLEMIFFPPLH